MVSKLTRGQMVDKVVAIEAKPEPIIIKLATTAVIVVDMQNDFGAEGGMFHSAGLDISMIQNIVSPITRVLGAAREVGIKIIYLKMAFKPDLSDLGAPDSPNRVRHLFFGVGEPTHAPSGVRSQALIRDTWNTEILWELAPKAGDTVLFKHRFSGFYQTELDVILKEMGIKHLIFTGCTTSVCVESTIRDAMFRDYSCVLLEDCSAEPIGATFQRSNHEASLLVIEKLFGWVSSSDEFIEALKSS